MRIEYPAVFNPFFQTPKRYNVAEGGRGRGASWTIARKFVTEGAITKNRYLCTRELQKSIKDSVHRLLVDQINVLGLQSRFVVYKDAIYSASGSEYIFKGLRHAISEIKSIEGITRCWVEEAEKVSEDSWMTLIPTIRREDSQFYISYNPEEEKNATYQRFSVRPPPDSNIIRSTYEDNPWFPEVLRREMEYDKSVDFEKYEHVWLGKLKKYADSLVLRGKFVIEDFETPESARFFHGSDFGYSAAPTTIVRCWMGKGTKGGLILYVDRDAGGVGIEINQTPRLYRSVMTVPGNWQIIGDSARPETISYLRQPQRDDVDGNLYPGFNIIGAEKGAGSVEDGIQFLRSFEKIVIHATNAKGTAKDAQNYRWKVDRITGQILPIPVDASNDYIDALRYAIEKYIKRKVSLFDLAAVLTK